MGRVCRQFDLVVSIKVVEQPHLVVGLRVTDEREKGEPVLDDPQVVHQISAMDKLDGGPDGDGGEGVENLLDTFVELSNVLDGQAGVIDLQSPGQVGLTEISHGAILEVQVFEGSLEGGQIGALRADGQGAQVVDFVSDKLFSERWFSDGRGSTRLGRYGR